MVESILHRVLAVRDGTVRVSVNDGVVSLTGRLDEYSAAVTAVRLSEAVPGVVWVDSKLTYVYDDTALETLTYGSA